MKLLEKILFLDCHIKYQYEKLFHLMDNKIDSIYYNTNSRNREYLPRNLTHEEIKEDESLGVVAIYKI